MSNIGNTARTNFCVKHSYQHPISSLHLLSTPLEETLCFAFIEQVHGGAEAREPRKGEEGVPL